MGDLASGWQTVLPSTHMGIERLDRAEREAYERQALEQWAQGDGNWSGYGKDVRDTEARTLHKKMKQNGLQALGSGGQGEVQKLIHTRGNRSVSLARKRLYSPWGMEILREEAAILERLSRDRCHQHIVKLIGTYTYHPRELYLILWPAATCDLSDLLKDLDDLRFNGGDREDILERLGHLELDDTSAIDHVPAVAQATKHSGKCPLKYLRQIMGCITQGVQFIHKCEVRHLDLKPQNILLNPGTVYLADFGISRDVHDQDHTMTSIEKGTKKWKSPERLKSNSNWSMHRADVYSLGLVFLNIAAVLYGAQQARLFQILANEDTSSRLEDIDRYVDDVLKLALVTQDFADEEAITFRPKHSISLTRRMLTPDPESRPDIFQINQELVGLGGLEQIYHGACCRVSPRSLTHLLDQKYAQVCGEKRRLEEENESMSKRLRTLERTEETYIMRLRHEEERHAKDRAHLLKQLDDERQAFEARLNESGRDRRQRPSFSGPRENNGGGLTMKPNMRSAKSPPSRNGRPPIASSISTPKIASITHRNAPQAEPDLRKSTESLLNYPLRSRPSGSRLPQPVHTSTPIRSRTPSMQVSRDPNLTDSTTDSLASSMFSNISRRTTGIALTPSTTNPSPHASKILLAVDRALTRAEDTATAPVGPSQLPRARGVAFGELESQDCSGTSAHNNVSENGGSVHGDMPHDGAEDKHVVTSRKPPSLATEKSWAAIAGDTKGLASMIGATARKKKKT